MARQKIMSFMLALVVVFVQATVFADPTNKFEVKIFPQECNIDLLHTGVNELTQLDPENCLPKPPTPPGPLQPPPIVTPRPFPQQEFISLSDLSPTSDFLQGTGFDSVRPKDKLIGSSEAASFVTITSALLVFLAVTLPLAYLVHPSIVPRIVRFLKKLKP